MPDAAREEPFLSFCCLSGSPTKPPTGSTARSSPSTEGCTDAQAHPPALRHGRHDAVTLTSTRSGRRTRPGPTSAHVSHVAGDSGWEFKLAQELEDMSRGRLAYVKNQSLGFHDSLHRSTASSGQYYPDFLARLDDGRGDG